MEKITGRVFGGVLAGLLLAVYVGATLLMIRAVYFYQSGDPALECLQREVESSALCFSQGYLNIVVTVGALLSALVIATLSKAEPGEMPAMNEIRPKSKTATRATKIVVFVYLMCWMAVGVLALVIGVMLKPGVLSSVSDIGNAWLGMAVAAAYAYFGIKPAASARQADEKDEEATESGEEAMG